MSEARVARVLARVLKAWSSSSVTISIGEQPSGVAEQFRATFQVPYQPGELTARAIRDSRMIAETTLTTVGDTVGLRLTVDRDLLSATGEDLAYLSIGAVDAKGLVQPNAGDAEDEQILADELALEMVHEIRNTLQALAASIFLLCKMLMILRKS